MNRKNKIINLRKQGKSFKEIGKIFGVSRQRIHQIVNGQKRYLKPIDQVKIFTKRKREHLGLPIEIKNYGSGGLDFVRELVRVRDNHTCQMCGKKWEEGKRRFDVHHLDENMESIKNIKYDRNNLDKMITYCHKCHLSLDSVIRKMQLGATHINTGWKKGIGRRNLTKIDAVL